MRVKKHKQALQIPQKKPGNFENRKPPAGVLFIEFALDSSGSIIIIPAISILLVFIISVIFSKTPGSTLYYFFLGPFRNVFNFGNMLNSAVPLLLGGLGVSIAMKAGSLNLGGEGQIYFGAFTSVAVSLALPYTGFLGGLTSILAGAAAAGFACALCGAFKAWWKTSELITTFLISGILIRVVNYLLSGPFLDPETNLQSSAKIDISQRLPIILAPSNLNAALYIGLAVLVIVHIFLYKTKHGYEFRIMGNNEIFARYGGINTKLNTIMAMFLSGSLYGLAGALAVFGTHHALIKDFSDGLGWNGLAAALIARFYPPALIPASLFLAWIGSGARIAMQNSGITFETAFIVQAVIFFLATSTVLASLFRKNQNRGQAGKLL